MSFTVVAFLSSMIPEYPAIDKKEASRQNKAELRWNIIEPTKEERENERDLTLWWNP